MKNKNKTKLNAIIRRSLSVSKEGGGEGREGARRGGGERGAVVLMADLTGCVGGRVGVFMGGVVSMELPIMFVGVRGG